ncbi:bacterial regulatory s, luxR family protein [Mycobacterium xenopi 4042]|uniref:Bacterial regulatory s, luxR family protein n=1 Tax=Mycobacterium xenopi 4042 TaxID=1299334 RepID=X8BJI0_MYCXE|nr:bacterial regulatory s, luxR family protein [Mycobacterium xenopi 4042]
MGKQDFDTAWAEGRRCPPRRRSPTPSAAAANVNAHQRLASLTPTERHVVKLVSEGLANNDIATRLFVSPRTVQTHLTHVYAKLGVTSRVQLVQEAARHA